MSASRHRPRRADRRRLTAALLAGLAFLAGCGSEEPDPTLPAATTEQLIASARDCAAAVSLDHTNLVLLRQRGWTEKQRQGQDAHFGMPFVVMVKSGEAPLMTIAENDDGTRVCSLSSRLREGASFEEVNAAFDATFGDGTEADGFYYYYREPDMVVLTRNPRAPDSQVQVAVMEPGVRALMEAGIIK